MGITLDVTLPVRELDASHKQMVEISRALEMDAKLIIMDEPTTALTRKEVDALFKVILQLKAQGISILFVSHKLNEVLEISETIAVMRNGRIVSVGDRSEYDTERLTFEMTGQKIAERNYEFTPDVGAPALLRVEGLNAGAALRDVSLEVRAGEIVGVTGLLGSGRTELALALFGLLTVDSGDIYVENKPVRIRSVQDAIAHGIGYVPEDRLTEGLFLEQSIGRNVVVRTVERLRGALGFTDLQKMDAQVKEWVGSLRIKTGNPDLPAKTLSGGNQQRVVLAKWLASNPRILILNGPTVGVDVGSKNELHEMIKRLAGEGMGLLVISDDIPELLQTCNRILLLRHGRIVEEIMPPQTDANELAAKLVEG